jgi:hypothetical protein
MQLRRKRSNKTIKMQELKIFRSWINGMLKWLKEVDEDGIYDISRLETYDDWQKNGFSCLESRADFVRWVELNSDVWSVEHFYAIDNLYKLWHVLDKNVVMNDDDTISITFGKFEE